MTAQRELDDFEVGDLVQHQGRPDVRGRVLERDRRLGQSLIEGDHRWWNSHNLYRIDTEEEGASS